MGVSDEEVKYVRENFEKKYAAKIASDTYDERDLRRLRTDDVYVSTFIRGPTRLDEAVDLVHESLLFRKEYEVNDLRINTFEQWSWDKHAMFYHGRTKTGHQILFLRVKQHKKNPALLRQVKQFYALWLESTFRTNPLDRVVVLFDMTEAGLSNLDMDFIRFTLTCFKLYYPTYLEKLLIYEMPWIFNAAWKVIKTWLSAEAIAKIKFASKSDIQTYIDADQLFEHMGGTCNIESAEFYPQLSEEGASAFSDPSDKRKNQVTFTDSTDSHSSRQSQNVNNNAASRTTSPRPSRHSHSAGSEGGSFAGRLLTISPADELTFASDDPTKEPSDVITLTNTLMYSIAFKVKTTAPEKYRVRPSTGVVKPGDAFEVHVYLQPGNLTAVEKDKFLVMAMEVTGDSYDTSLWKTAPKDTIMEHRLRCVAPGHVDFNVNVPMPMGKGVTEVANQAKSFITSQFESQPPIQITGDPMEMLIESNRQLQRRMGWLIVSQIVFFCLTLLFFAAFFCLGEDLFSSYLFPFGYCVSSSWRRGC